MVQVYSYSGNRVEIPETPERIVSFSPSLTEIVFELGLGNRVKGITAFCVRPEQTKNVRKIGSYGYVRREILDQIDPDLVLTISGYQDAFSRELSQHYPVVCFELPSTVNGIFDLITKVGLVVGNAEGARDLSMSLSQYMPSSKPANNLKAYIEIDLASPTSFGSFSYITDALRLFGLRNIYGGVRREWLTPDLNHVKDEDPDVIIYEPKMFSKFSDRDAIELIHRRGWEKLKAVSTGHFYTTPGPYDFFAHHGPSFLKEVLPWLNKKISQI